jgi:translocation and assembly module TamA
LWPTRDRMLSALQSAGFALARVDMPAAALDPQAQALDVSFTIEPGPRVDLGRISISGLDRLHESYVRRRLLLHPGERYDPAKIEKARQDLASVGAISSVRIRTPDQVDARGTLPVDVAITERALHAVNLGAAYSTDLGVTLSASWMHRNLFGNAETLTLSAGTTGGGTATRSPGYNAGAVLVLPDWLQRDQALTFNLAAIRESLTAYDRTAVLAGATFSRKLTPDLTASVGLALEQARFVQEHVARDYTLAQLPVGLQYDSTHVLPTEDAVHGVRASVTITPTDSLGRRNATFFIAQAAGSTYLDASDLLGEQPGRSVVALRALLGMLAGANTFDIPPDQRFYGGGGGTIRGFRYQSVGPKFPDGRPVGGTAIDVGTIELRQRFGASWGAAAFVDAGQVGSSGTPFNGNLAVGAGVGARYYTSIGAIRADIAVPVTQARGSDSLEFYIGIGQAF